MSASLMLETPRLILVASPREWVGLSLTDSARFAALLECRLSVDWPTPFDRDGYVVVVSLMSGAPAEVGWWIWWVLEKDSVSSGPPYLIGNVGFKGVAEPDGVVELSYSLVPSAQGRGLATEGVGALIDWAFLDPRVTRLIATICPSNLASQRVAAKCGLRLFGDQSRDWTLQFELNRSVDNSVSVGNTKPYGKP